MKSYVLGAVLSSVMVAGPALADNDFHALGGASNLKPMAEENLGAVEGGFAFNKFSFNKQKADIWQFGASYYGDVINQANITQQIGDGNFAVSVNYVKK
ncbi:hypothetical protein [Methylocaldum sp.]|uniref:hypothetical protein n=1 Tax=Methylocaldum sp. TaxID=1969727 RepID=UPI002D3E55FC|nr:hypothetical protein [Methylocaldum sp.]HYE35068.1 hypothetical protein [Methylocaldum sp.]